MTNNLRNAVVELKLDDVRRAVEQAIKAGEEPLQILGELRDGMSDVGQRYQTGDYFLADLMLSAKIFTEGVGLLQPLLDKAGPAEPLGRVVLATLKGDIHDLGKNILGALLRAQGFEVYDLGVDVDPVVLCEKVKEVKPHFVGLSALITSVFASMEQAVKLLDEAGLRKDLKLMVGGGVTSTVLKDHLGADMQTIDAMEGVSYCLKTIKEN